MLAPMRRMAAISVLLASGGLLTGCGSGGHAASSTTARAGASAGGAAGTRTKAAPAPGARGAPAGAGRTLAKAQAMAFARAVNLRPADVPGFRASSEHERKTAAEKRLEPELRRCLGSSAETKGLVESSSKGFERAAGIASQSVSSEVTVAQAPAVVDKELATIRGGHLPACLSHYFDLLLESQNIHGASIGPVSTKQGSPPAPGMTGSFGLRFTTTVTVSRVRIPFSIDILGFVDGPAEVSLFTFGVPRPFPAAVEERLFSLLLERAKTHKI